MKDEKKKDQSFTSVLWGKWFFLEEVFFLFCLYIA